ncbi:hypothetical protein CDD83_2043 [Cordyceps sp. RAO-2017]|nr:hypothetical protein CDD83_2043 [Cordyceps sp. RAO-2017]
MSPPKYEPLNRQPLCRSCEESLDENGDAFRLLNSNLSTNGAGKIVYVLFALLGISITSNVLLATKLRVGAPRLEAAPSISGLKWNVLRPNANEAVSLDDTLWDNPDLQENVGSLKSFRDGKEQWWPMGHVAHCLHLLLNDATCKADDMPLSTGQYVVRGNSTTFLAPGEGQLRVCRDFKKLAAYAKEHSACYFRPPDHYISISERYKHCPDGSKPWLEKREQKSQA